MKPTLKEYLKHTGQSYEVFAQKVGLTKQRIGQIIKGKESLTFEVARKIWVASDYEIRFISLYPNLGPVLEDLKHVDKEDVIAHHEGCDN